VPQLFPLFSVRVWNAARKNLSEPIDRTAWLLRWKGFEFPGGFRAIPSDLFPFIEGLTAHPWHLQVRDLYSRSFRVCFDELITGGDHTMAVDSLREFGEPQERAWSVYTRFLRSVASGSSGAAASVAPTPRFAGAHVAFVMRENMLRGGLRQRMFGNLNALRATSESDERVYKTSTLLFDGMPVASLFAVLDAVEILVGVYSGGPSRHSTTQHNTTRQQHSTTQQ
jgi:hypothetical protein